MRAVCPVTNCPYFCIERGGGGAGIDKDILKILVSSLIELSKLSNQMKS